MAQVICPTVSEQRFLLPGLRTLHCSVPTEWSEDLIYLASPSLCSIFLHPDPHRSSFPVSAEVELKVLSRMKMPALRTLDIELVHIDNPIAGISPFQSITVLSVGGCSPAVGSRFLEELSCLGQVEMIELAFNKFYTADADGQSRPISWKCGSVTTLKKVYISGMPSGIVVFMEGLQGCALNNLFIEIEEDLDQPSPSLHDIGRLGKSLAIAGTESLDTLIINDTVSMLPRLRLLGATNETLDDGSSELVLSNAFIDSFLQFQNLKILRYAGECFHLNGSEVDAIIKSTSWRKTLHEFRIPRADDDHSPKEYNTSPPDLQQLQQLALALPNLKILDLYIHLNDDIPSPSFSSFDPGKTSHLEILYIETDKFLEEDSIIPIGEYIDHILPNLLKVRSAQIGQEYLWKAVSKTILLCQRVRKRTLVFQSTVSNR